MRGLADSLEDSGTNVDAGDAYNAIAHHAGGISNSAQPAVEAAFAHSIHVVFTAAVPFAAVMLVLACLIPSVPLRKSVGDDAQDTAASPPR
ncbi:hypothetical protein KEF29_23640 [Streptomyces tuirus]|uniref:Uncharacterized protein n=1 Tax=Streptomyces tuirus TaxID=68278 RepID=A0A941J6W1_9ACTN|nr:hypothetical protein [Streptomyces tuirus]